MTVIKTLMRKAYMQGARYSGLSALFSPLLSGVGAILMFHHVRPWTGGVGLNQLLEVEPDFLDRLLDDLNRDMRFVSMDEAADRLLRELVRGADPDDERQATEVGALVAQLWALRRLSLQIAGSLDRGEAPDVAAAAAELAATDAELAAAARARRSCFSRSAFSRTRASPPAAMSQAMASSNARAATVSAGLPAAAASKTAHPDTGVVKAATIASTPPG